MRSLPFLLVAGARECAEGTIAVRDRDGEDLGSMPLADALAYLQQAASAPDAPLSRAANASVRERLGLQSTANHRE